MSLLQTQYTINVNQRRLTIKLFPFLLLLIIVFLFIKLGFWQLDRASEKESILSRYQVQASASIIDLKSIHHFNDALQYKPVRLSGVVDNEHQFLLDNQYANHRFGYHVITPVLIDNDEYVALVNRGWVPAGYQRELLPILPKIKTPVTWRGRVYIPSKKGLTLSQAEDNPNEWPRIIEKIDFKRLERELGKPVYPFIIRLDVDQAYGFNREWKLVSVSPQRHHMYAVQWFLFAFVLTLVYTILQITRRSDEKK